jgi:hypothetical protein
MVQRKIETIVEDVDLKLKTTQGQQFGVYGKLTVSFECPKCYNRVKAVLDYQGEHPSDTERKCEFCEEPYTITNTISIVPHVGNSGEVEINRQMKPIIDRIKAGSE